MNKEDIHVSDIIDVVIVHPSEAQGTGTSIIQVLRTHINQIEDTFMAARVGGEVLLKDTCHAVLSYAVDDTTVHVLKVRVIREDLEPFIRRIRKEYCIA